MARDRLDIEDKAAAGLAEARPARFPCPVCGRETSEHVGPQGTRICSQPACRHVSYHHEIMVN